MVERKEYKKAMTSRHRRWIGLIVVVNLLMLFFTKYLNFAIDNINRFLELLHHNGNIETLPLLMPLGISFYTLSAIGYVNDVARGSCKAEKNYGRLLLFLSFFPLITEGPIERYTGLGKQRNPQVFPDRRRAVHHRGGPAGTEIFTQGTGNNINQADDNDRYITENAELQRRAA